MKLVLVTLLFALFAVAMAAAPQRQMLFTYPKDTPISVMDEAKDTIRNGGGMVTHEFDLIKGFIATTTTKALEQIKTLSSQWIPNVEDDGIVSANDL